MSENEITETLQAFRDAVEADEFAEAEDVLGRLNDLYDRVESEEASRVKQIHGAVSEGAITGEEREVVQQYVGQKVATGVARVGVLMGGGMYLLSPGEVEGSDVLEGVDELIEHEKEKVDKENLARGVVSDAELPAFASIVDVTKSRDGFVVGDLISIDVTVQNVGDSPASDIELLSRVDLDVKPDSVNVGELEPGAERTLTFELAASEGDYEIEFVLESADAGSDSKRAELSIRSKRSVTKFAAQSIGEIRELVDGKNSLTDGWRTALFASLDEAATNVDDALQFMDGAVTGPPESPGRGKTPPGRGPPHDGPGRGPPGDSPGRGPDAEKRANNALTTAINQMGAFLNKVIDFRDEEGGAAVPDAFWYTLERRAELVIDQLARARRAELVESHSDEETDTHGDEENDDRGPPDDNDGRGRGPPEDDEHPGRGSNDESNRDSSGNGRGRQDEDESGRNESEGDRNRGNDESGGDDGDTGRGNDKSEDDDGDAGRGNDKSGGDNGQGNDGGGNNEGGGDEGDDDNSGNDESEGNGGDDSSGGNDGSGGDDGADDGRGNGETGNGNNGGNGGRGNS